MDAYLVSCSWQNPALCFNFQINLELIIHPHPKRLFLHVAFLAHSDSLHLFM